MAYVHVPYSKGAFLPNLVFLAIVVGGSAGVLFMASAELLPAAALLAVESAALVVLGISPLMTEHSVLDGTLSLRQGWYFRADIPLGEIESAARLDQGPRRVGVFFKLTSATLYVTSRRYDLIQLTLRSERKFGWALGKRASTVVFDAEDAPRAIRALGK